MLKKRNKIILLLAVIVISALVYFRPPLVEKTIGDIGNLQTLQYRWWAWEIAIKGWWDRPIVGQGLNNYLISFNRHYNPLYQETTSSIIWYDAPHNYFLQLLNETGLIGFFAFLLFMFVLFKKLRTHPKKLILIPLFVAYFIHLFFLFPTINGIIIFLVLVAYVSLNPIQQQANKKVIRR